MKSDSRRAIAAALIANLGIAVAKFIGYFFTGAASMLAEAIHSLADTSNQGLLFMGGALSRRRPTRQRPFGYGRERYFWAFMVAVVIFTIGALFALFEGIGKIAHPHQLESPGWAVGILVLAAALESWSFRTAIRESNRERRGQSWRAFVLQAKIPELPVVLLEDLGALIGLLCALIGVGLTLITGDARFDALGSIAIGVLLGAIAILLAIRMKSLLIGESATAETEGAIEQAIEADAAVGRLIHLRTEHIGPDVLLVAAKVEFQPGMTGESIAAAIDALEVTLRAAVPIARLIFIEPDVYHAQPAAGGGPAGRTTPSA
ncbi:MAG: cation diffusion facilitator family transporter [Deltaproteobacteria bacterium]|nr:cation diffusion facilitator family transporter [Deltaproteobacteria bacterium]